MSKNLPIRVEFYGAALEGVIVNGRPYVAMKPIADGLGIRWAQQLEKLKADPVLGPELYYISSMVAGDGKRREMICLPEDRLQGWLFRINPDKVKPGTREKVIIYQSECYRFLHDAFSQGKAAAFALTQAIDSKRATARVMTDVVKDVLEFDGKEPRPHHFTNEHRLCNWALRGSFDPIDEDTLSADEADMLAQIRRRNSVLIARGVDYTARKPLLRQFAAELRSPSSPQVGRAA